MCFSVWLDYHKKAFFLIKCLSSSSALITRRGDKHGRSCGGFFLAWMRLQSLWTVTKEPRRKLECQLWVWRRNRINKEPKGWEAEAEHFLFWTFARLKNYRRRPGFCVWSRACEVHLRITKHTSNGILSTWVITLSRLSCSFSSDDLPFNQETFIINSPSPPPVPVGFRGGSPANRRRDIDLLKEHSGTSIPDLDETKKETHGAGNEPLRNL